ncbi:MAG: ATP-binding cassette domain-containing protein [Dermatophilaceae bacterium]
MNEGGRDAPAPLAASGLATSAGPVHGPVDGPAVRVRGLQVRRGERLVLPGLDLDVPRGAVVGLLGPSGGGKSTLLRAIVGVQQTHAGSIEVLGRPAGSPELRHQVAYVTQSPSVYPDLSVRDNLRYLAAILGAGVDRVERAVAAVDLADHADDRVDRLSGGQRARASLAGALVSDPELLVLDEPTVGLDPVLRRDLWDLFHRLADRGATLLVSSHVMDEAARCDRLLLVREGRILADDTPADLLRRTGSPDAEAAFLSLVEAHQGVHPPQTSAAAPARRREEPAATGAAKTTGGRGLPATAVRVLRQLRGDHRTIALLLVVPCVLLGLLAWMYTGTPMFAQVGPPLLGIFPFTVMFVVTSVTMLRERTGGTLERLMTTPLRRGDLIGGYALAFGVAAIVQALVATAWSVGVCGLEVRGPLLALVLVALLNALGGTAFGLLASAFARTEFQAVQFLPAFVFPQFLLAGLLVPRDDLPRVLKAVSDVFPLSYAVDAIQYVAREADPWADMRTPLLILVGFCAVALVSAALTLPRRTP